MHEQGMQSPGASGKVELALALIPAHGKAHPLDLDFLTDQHESRLELAPNRKTLNTNWNQQILFHFEVQVAHLHSVACRNRMNKRQSSVSEPLAVCNRMCAVRSRDCISVGGHVSQDHGSLEAMTLCAGGYNVGNT